MTVANTPMSVSGVTWAKDPGGVYRQPVYGGNGAIQFSDSGIANGAATDLRYDKTARSLTVGDVTVGPETVATPSQSANSITVAGVATWNSSGLHVGNGSVSVDFGPSGLSIVVGGTFSVVVNSTGLYVGNSTSAVAVTANQLSVGNSSSNVSVNSTAVYHDGSIYPTPAPPGP